MERGILAAFHVFVILIGAFNHGYNISVIDGPKYLFTGASQPKVFHISDFFWGVVVSSFCFGSILGSLATNTLLKKLGFRTVVLIGDGLYLVGNAMIGLSTNSSMFILGRILGGIASGTCATVTPIYLSAISPAKIRGKVCAFNPGAIVTGLLCAQIVSTTLAVPAWWRYLFGLSFLMCLIQALLVFFVPEPEQTADKPLEEDQDLSLYSVLKLDQARKSVWVAVAYHVTQQLSGINAVFYFASTLFGGRATAMTFGALNCVGTVGSIWLMDNVGRRRLSLFSCASMLIGCLGIMMSFAMDSHGSSLVFAAIYVGGYSVGMGSIPWVIMGDIFPRNALNAGTTIAVTLNWTFSGIVGLVVPLVIDSCRSTIFLPFAATLALFWVYNYFFIPETKGRSAQFL